ncbi:ATP-binding protein [Thiolapillus sp.]|uniref:ATP-binding protein n=2 Tax=Thiolapillus sp. TaxID=2017437 RepID=UPI0025F8611C|nr:ATP-binding protein [Thiolapillus sp.]
MNPERVQVTGQAKPGIWHILRTGRLLFPSLLLASGVLLGSVVALGALFGQGLGGPGIYLLVLASGLALVGLVAFMLQMKRQLLMPLAVLENSVARVSQGEPGATLPDSDTGVFHGMVQDIDSISEELMDLYEDMDSRIARHTTRLAQKTASLKILYDVAATINEVEDLDELLLRFLRVLKEMVNGIAISARVVQLGGRMRLVGAIGLDDELQREAQLLPLEICPCGMVLSPGDVCCEHEAQYCVHQLGRKMYGSDEVEMIPVPLEYQGDVLGEYDIYVQKPGVSDREDIMELLATVGSHLGMAVAKHRSDENAHRLSIYEERNALAHELHDSLAQTLASLRFQIRMMEDSLQQVQGCRMVEEDLERIRNGVDEAHTELRELLNSFRASMDGRDLSSALEKLVQRFSSETGIPTYYQQECAQLKLSSSEEMQMLRIVQEALANTRKHARAHTVRVLLTCRAGRYVLLVEDDGVGFEGKAREGHPGEHIGLSIMEERARRLGGELRIESEVGEGTRVELIYAPEVQPRDIDRKWTS